MCVVLSTVVRCTRVVLLWYYNNGVLIRQALYTIGGPWYCWVGGEQLPRSARKRRLEFGKRRWKWGCRLLWRTVRSLGLGKELRFAIGPPGERTKSRAGWMWKWWWCEMWNLDRCIFDTSAADCWIGRVHVRTHRWSPWSCDYTSRSWAVLVMWFCLGLVVVCCPETIAIEMWSWGRACSEWFPPALDRRRSWSILCAWWIRGDYLAWCWPLRCPTGRGCVHACRVLHICRDGFFLRLYSCDVCLHNINNSIEISRYIR